MKKKNLLMMALSVCMVAVVAVGGTLAYLSDTDGTLTNHFKFADNIAVDVYEYTPTGGETKEQNGYDYKNLVVGDELKKDVDVDVTTTVETYLFINIKSVGSGTSVELGDINDAWTAVQADEQGYGIYRLTKNVSTTATDINVFDTVTVPEVTSVENGQYADVVLNDVDIDVFAMQATGYDVDAAETEALKAFA